MERKSHEPVPGLPPPRPGLPHPEERAYWEALFSSPEIAPDAWVAPTATVLGRVRIGARSSVWFGTVVRGDDQFIEIGEDTNIQDLSLVHIDERTPCRIGSRVTVGHQATIHAATIEDDALIGIRAAVLTGARIGEGALIAAGAVVLENTVVPPGTLWAGCPARKLRDVDTELSLRMGATWRLYANSAFTYRLRFQDDPRSQASG